eukprot:TRINITY_DN21558_c0_g1_i1.p1 TRINITY_DN21558_c0_g1~~TRINITY_DN21558_c0_g1_i1.p1  ORF type:complete len:358 (+),score=42.84 TRINITY_DN21558_c0_g1_i1:38-1111(+)
MDKWYWYGLVVLLAVHLSSYPRWEMIAMDVLFKGVEGYTLLKCMWDNQRACPAEETLMILGKSRDQATAGWAPLDSARWDTRTFALRTRDRKEIPLFIAVPRNASKGSKLPVLVEFHGGGHVMGVPTIVLVAASLERAGAEFVVVSPGYRKAPKFPFPFAPHDCLDTLLWVHQNAAQVHGDPEAVWIAGVSAGGNLAAAVTYAAAQDPAKYGRVRGQILFAPITDFHFATPSFHTHWTTPIWSGQKALSARRFYIPDPARWKNPLASPLYGAKWEGMPKSFVVVDSYDPLRDEGVAYKEKLVKGGNEVVFVEVVGYHGAELMFGISGMGYRRDYAELVEKLGRFFNDQKETNAGNVK